MSFHQRLIANPIDVSWNALASLRDELQCLRFEKPITTMASHFQSMSDVTGSFLRGKRLQVLHDGDALQQLGQVFLPKFVSELWLAGKNDLQQFRVGRLEIRK